jgi:hypothetical protein
MAVLEEIEDDPPAPPRAPPPAPPASAPAAPEEDSDDDEPPPLDDSAAQLDAVQARKRVADRVAAARAGGSDAASSSPSAPATTNAPAAPASSSPSPSRAAGTKPSASAGMKKGFFDAPRSRPRATERKQQPAGEPEMVFLRGSKTRAAGGKEIPDFMRVEVEGTEAAARMKRELVEKLKPDKQTVDEVMGDKDLLAGFDDPEVMRAVDDVAKNPRNIAKYADNPKVLAFYSRMAGMVGNRLEKMGDNSQSGR